jgi:arylformamidase
MKTNFLYLSYIVDENTPTYGNRNKFNIYKKSDILKGDIANDSFIETTAHIGTHLDIPYHFYENGQTIEDFGIDYFNFESVLFLEISSENILIDQELIQELEKIKDKNRYEILIVKTGICYKRGTEEFWNTNYGFVPTIADYLRKKFPNIRVFGFDSISVSSFQERMVGRESHKSFLNPKNPILLLEDMDLRYLSKDIIIKKVTIAPVRISKCDGLPCTVIAEIK